MVRSGGTMKEFDIDNILRELISGDIDVEDLSEIIGERLFKLRQKPDLTSEQELLSNLELYIHEAEEGYRGWDELYEYIFSIIKRSMSEDFVKTVTLNTSSTSEFQTTTRVAIPVKDYRRDLSLV
jgi:hypothetical protein